MTGSRRAVIERNYCATPPLRLATVGGRSTRAFGAMANHRLAVVERQIAEAFRGGVLGNGIGLRQTQIIDREPDGFREERLAELQLTTRTSPARPHR